MGLYDNLGDKLFYTRGILHKTGIFVILPLCSSTYTDPLNRDWRQRHPTEKSCYDDFACINNVGLIRLYAMH